MAVCFWKNRKSSQRAFHSAPCIFRQVHQNADRVLFVLAMKKLKLGLECLKFVIQ